jgi:hypothetical protein
VVRVRKALLFCKNAAKNFLEFWSEALRIQRPKPRFKKVSAPLFSKSGSFRLDLSSELLGLFISKHS